MAARGKTSIWIYIGVFALLTVGSWIAFEVYRNLTETTVPKVQQIKLKPLPPEIGDDLLSTTRARRRFSDAELSRAVAQPVPELGLGGILIQPDQEEVVPPPTPSVNQTPVASGSGTIVFPPSQSSESTGSGTLSQ